MSSSTESPTPVESIRYRRYARDERRLPIPRGRGFLSGFAPATGISRLWNLSLPNNASPAFRHIGRCPSVVGCPVPTHFRETVVVRIASPRNECTAHRKRVGSLATVYFSAEIGLKRIRVERDKIVGGKRNFRPSTLNINLINRAVDGTPGRTGDPFATVPFPICGEIRKGRTPLQTRPRGARE
jgi:hypothetical protein